MEEERKRILIEKETVFLLREKKMIKNIFRKGYDELIQLLHSINRNPN